MHKASFSCYLLCNRSKTSAWRQKTIKRSAQPRTLCCCGARWRPQGGSMSRWKTSAYSCSWCLTALVCVSQLSERQHPQLHHQLAWWNGVQCPHSQTQVPTSVHLHQKLCFSNLISWTLNAFDLSRPDLIDFDKLKKSNAHYNLQNAFNLAEQHLGLTKLLDPEGKVHPGLAASTPRRQTHNHSLWRLFFADISVDHPDEKSVITYVVTYYHYFSKMKALKVEGKRIGKVWVFKTRKLLEGSPFSVKKIWWFECYVCYLFIYSLIRLVKNIRYSY